MRLFGYLIKMPHLHLEVFQKWKLLVEGDPRVELELDYIPPLAWDWTPCGPPGGTTKYYWEEGHLEYPT